jgi:hypothetical protein
MDFERYIAKMFFTANKIWSKYLRETKKRKQQLKTTLHALFFTTQPFI